MSNPKDASKTTEEVEPTQSTASSSGIVIFFVAVFVILAVVKCSSPKSEFKMYDPARTRAVNAAVEAADIRSDFTLTDEQVKAISERAFLEEVRKK